MKVICTHCCQNYTIIGHLCKHCEARLRRIGIFSFPRQDKKCDIKPEIIISPTIIIRSRL